MHGGGSRHAGPLDTTRSVDRADYSWTIAVFPIVEARGGCPRGACPAPRPPGDREKSRGQFVRLVIGPLVLPLPAGGDVRPRQPIVGARTRSQPALMEPLVVTWRQRRRAR